MHILIVNGPNLNRLGKRETEIYGTTTLRDIESRLKKKFPDLEIEFYQSNSEGDIIDKLQRAADGAAHGVIINPGAYAHYSYAIRDALSALQIPVVGIHLTNVHAREKFRHASVTPSACKGVIAGFGPMSYELAVRFLVEK
jgi:3-dehydroquinate dehydratase-2